jgi:hypothetical protein
VSGFLATADMGPPSAVQYTYPMTELLPLVVIGTEAVLQVGLDTGSVYTAGFGFTIRGSGVPEFVAIARFAMPPSLRHVATAAFDAVAIVATGFPGVPAVPLTFYLQDTPRPAVLSNANRFFESADPWVVAGGPVSTYTGGSPYTVEIPIDISVLARIAGNPHWSGIVNLAVRGDWTGQPMGAVLAFNADFDLQVRKALYWNPRHRARA